MSLILRRRQRASLAIVPLLGCSHQCSLESKNPIDSSTIDGRGAESDGAEAGLNRRVRVELQTTKHGKSPDSWPDLPFYPLSLFGVPSLSLTATSSLKSGTELFLAESLIRLTWVLSSTPVWMASTGQQGNRKLNGLKR